MTERHHPQGEDADAAERVVIAPDAAAEVVRLVEEAEAEAIAILVERLAARPQELERRALARDAVVRQHETGDVGGRTEVLQEGLGQRVLGSRLGEERQLVGHRLARAAGEQPRDEEGERVRGARVVREPPALEVLPLLAAGAEDRTVLPPEEASRHAPEDEAGVAFVRGESTTLAHDARRLTVAVDRGEERHRLGVRDRGEELRHVDGRGRRLNHRARALLLRRHRGLRHLEDRVVALRLRQPVETRIRSRTVELAHSGVQLAPDTRHDPGSADESRDFFLAPSSHGESSTAMAAPHSSAVPEPQATN